MHLYVFLVIFGVAFVSLLLGLGAKGIYAKFTLTIISAVLFLILAVASFNIEITNTVVASTVINATTNATEYTYTTLSRNVSADWVMWVMLMLAIPGWLKVFLLLPEVIGDKDE